MAATGRLRIRLGVALCAGVAGVLLLAGSRPRALPAAIEGGAQVALRRPPRFVQLQQAIETATTPQDPPTGAPDTIESLVRVARSASNVALPPLPPRNLNRSSAVLPDVNPTHPRLQAIDALAGRPEAIAGEALVAILTSKAEEVLRMQAAQRLERLAQDDAINGALRHAAVFDHSPYVRLAALHSLKANRAPALMADLDRIVNHDGDDGVRDLAEHMFDERRSQ